MANEFTSEELAAALAKNPLIRGMALFAGGQEAPVVDNPLLALPGMAADITGGTADLINAGMGLRDRLTGNVGPNALKTPRIPYSFDQAANQLGVNPDSLMVQGGALARPDLKDLKFALPLLHASPFKFDMFDFQHLGKGEGAQAYSRGMYFSDADLERGTHKNYLYQFRRHDNLKPSVINEAGEEAPEIIQTAMRNAIQKKELNTDELVIDEIESELDWFYEAHLNSLNKGMDDLERHGQTHIDVAHETELTQRYKAAIDWLNDNYPAKINRVEPYSYEVDFPDEVIDGLPIWDYPINKQPEKYRKQVEAVAQKMNEGDIPDRVVELQEAIDQWQEFLDAAHWKDAPNFRARIELQIEKANAELMELKKMQGYGFDPDQKWGDVIREMENKFGADKTQQMLLEQGIPGVRNRTYSTRQNLRGQNGIWAQLKTAFNPKEEVFNYAMYDLSLINKVIRRQTKNGEILHDTAEVVFERQPDLIKTFDYHNPSPQHQKFLELADAQRGSPEIAMRQVQTAMGGGVLSPVVEHVGDLTHRMAESTAFANGDMGLEYVKPKIKKTLGYLESRYGFEREMLENMSSNASQRGVSLDEYKAGIDQTLAKYAEEHAKLPTFNEAQKTAQAAAVAIGEQRWKDAIQHLRQLDEWTNDKETWVKVASAIN